MILPQRIHSQSAIITGMFSFEKCRWALVYMATATNYEVNIYVRENQASILLSHTVVQYLTSTVPAQCHTVPFFWRPSVHPQNPNIPNFAIEHNKWVLPESCRILQGHCCPVSNPGNRWLSAVSYGYFWPWPQSTRLLPICCIYPYV